MRGASEDVEEVKQGTDNLEWKWSSERLGQFTRKGSRAC